MFTLQIQKKNVGNKWISLCLPPQCSLLPFHWLSWRPQHPLPGHTIPMALLSFWWAFLTESAVRCVYTDTIHCCMSFLFTNERMPGDSQVVKQKQGCGQKVKDWSPGHQHPTEVKMSNKSIIAKSFPSSIIRSLVNACCLVSHQVMWTAATWRDFMSHKYMCSLDRHECLLCARYYAKCTDTSICHLMRDAHECLYLRQINAGDLETGAVLSGEMKTAGLWTEEM